ncbi:sodium-coupled neutral amino acid transporter 7-like, partial [Saccoglossus kowalevskii]|uniref:Sodium-coupled neutral amino acid transporter 7-like n=1 Tax=Saccoglossus kowalevskii TaxID=10224 RepID=A0ABM0GTS7_SACKO
MSIQTNVPRETSPLLTGNKLTRSQSSSWLDSPSSPSHPRQGRIIDVEIKDENTTNSNDGQNSLLGAIFIIVNACLGAGVLNFPSAYSSAGGISISVALQVILVLFAALALLVLAFCADIHGSTTYENSVASLCGPKILLACQATVILYSFGACITYMIIVADQTDKVMEFIAGSHYSQNWYTNRKFTLTLVSFILILPLCFPKKIEFLKYS